MTDSSGMATRDAFAQFPQGIVLCAAEVEGEPVGLVLSSFMVGVSLHPPLVAMAVQNTSTSWPRLREQESIGISLLGSAHRDSIQQLAAAPHAERFAGVDYRVDDGGALILADAPAWLTVRPYDTYRAGDHDVVLLEVLDSGHASEQEPVVIHRRAYKGLA